ncbi:MAG: TetR/AcrR family transcriptional regulator [Proteobacteria bacterium]|nr:TetR/AcrR family transcriptional regulator [Pseudomonadota bacterium]
MSTESAEKLLDAATRLFVAHGIERVNSNQIAREAGVGVGTFYAHFKDKHELHQSLVLSALDALRVRVEKAVAAGPADPEQQVRRTVEAVIAFAEEQPDRFRIAFLGGGRFGYSTRGVERRLRELQEEGAVDRALHPGTAARAFASMQSGVLLWWLEDPSRGSRAEVFETLVRLHPALRRP